MQSYERCLVHCFRRARSAPRQAPVLGRVKAQDDAMGLAQPLGKNARFCAVATSNASLGPERREIINGARAVRHAPAHQVLAYGGGEGD